MTNKASRKLCNNYHVQKIETLVELAVRVKGFIDLEKAISEDNLLTTSPRVILEPRRDGIKTKNDKKGSEKPKSETPGPSHR